MYVVAHIVDLHIFTDQASFARILFLLVSSAIGFYHWLNTGWEHAICEQKKDILTNESTFTLL